MLEYTIPFVLSRLLPDGTPTDQLPFNAPSGIVSASELLFLFDEAKCWTRPGMRVTRDNVPQADGDIVHKSFTTGMQQHLSVQFWKTRNDRACGEDLRVMNDFLMLRLNVLRNTNGRMQWTPSGYGADRMLNEVRLLEWPVATYQDGVVAVEFDLYTPFPYAIDEVEQDIELNAVIDNVGNADFYPVIKLFGPADSFELLNFTTGFSCSYDSSLPNAITIAGGHYAEFDFFRNTVYLDGNSTNLKPGLVVASSDFWPIIPGPNDIQLIGDGTATVLFNPAWLS